MGISTMSLYDKALPENGMNQQTTMVKEDV
jgi:hypothetical protein